MKHYIIIEVDEPEREPGEHLETGELRKHCHTFTPSRYVQVSDIVVRADRPALAGAPNGYAQIQSIFTETMGAARATARQHAEQTTTTPPAGHEPVEMPTAAPLTCRCGLVMTPNPHPDAGLPSKVNDVGATYVCIPCTARALAGWGRRARLAEHDAAHYARLLRESGINPHAGLP